MRWLSPLCVLTVVAAVVAACNNEAAHPAILDDGKGDPVNGTTGDSSIPSTVSNSDAYSIEIGGGVPVAPGQQVGYALTAIAPLSYQFRWTGDAAATGTGYHNFVGSVWTAGKFTSITPGCLNAACPLESGDSVSTTPILLTVGERVDWNTDASTGFDGFSFTVDTEPVYFDVFIDGARHPELFYFPVAPNGVTTEPAQSPFNMISVPLATDGGTSDAAVDGAVDGSATDSGTATDSGAD